MSRKHNTKHNRTPSNYKKRLAKRGLTKAPNTSQIINAVRKAHGMGPR